MRGFALLWRMTKGQIELFNIIFMAVPDDPDDCVYSITMQIASPPINWRAPTLRSEVKS